MYAVAKPFINQYFRCFKTWAKSVATYVPTTAAEFDLETKFLDDALDIAQALANALEHSESYNKQIFRRFLTQRLLNKMAILMEGRFTEKEPMLDFRFIAGGEICMFATNVAEYIAQISN